MKSFRISLRFDDIEMQNSLAEKSEEIQAANDLQLRDKYELYTYISNSEVVIYHKDFCS